MQDASSRVYQTNYKGNLEREINLPGIGSAAGFNGNADDKEIFLQLFIIRLSCRYFPAVILPQVKQDDLFRKSEVKSVKMLIIIRLFNLFSTVKTEPKFHLCLLLIKEDYN